MACNFQSAMIHLFSALKIARQCRKALASDELASAFIQAMIQNIPDPITPPPELDKDPPNKRMAKTVVKLESEYERLTSCAERVAFSKVPEKSELLAIVEETRQETQWILSRYNTLELYEKWLRRSKILHHEDSFSECLLQTNEPGPFQGLVSQIDDHLAITKLGKDIADPVPLDEWRKSAAKESLMVLVLSAQTDLPLRHITMDFFEVSRQIRWPGQLRTLSGT